MVLRQAFECIFWLPSTLGPRTEAAHPACSSALQRHRPQKCTLNPTSTALRVALVLQIKEWGPFAVRRYERSTWAAVCTHTAYHEEAMWHGVAELMSYIRGDNHKGVPGGRLSAFEGRGCTHAAAAGPEAGRA